MSSDQENQFNFIERIDEIPAHIERKIDFTTVLYSQGISICLTLTGIVTTLLSGYNISIPTTQSLLNYLIISICYAGIPFFNGENVFQREKLFFYVILSFFDVEANFLVVSAYRYTTITSIMLIDCLTIPFVMILSHRFLHTTYNVHHILGAFVSLIGLIFLAINDIFISESDDSQYPNKILGDLLCVLGAVCYSISNVGQEYFLFYKLEPNLKEHYPNMNSSFVKRKARNIYLGVLTSCAVPISIIQLLLTELDSLISVLTTQNEILPVSLLLFLFTIAMFTIYNGFPLVIQRSSATYLNLSLLTSDFFAFFVGFFLFHSQFTFWYPVAFLTVIIGLVIYHHKKDTTAPAAFFPQSSPDQSASESVSDSVPPISHDHSSTRLLG